ncbi:hypothetical protein [Streptomyces sp. UG1]|uniref:hypothetical protein n=1 Tax=Streptomyces sp. UG1 TaxID=3417652 RepID=UPI003CEF2022
MRQETTYRTFRLRGRATWLARGVAGTAVLAAVVALGGCSSSPKEELIESADKKCDSINDRFAGDLAYGRTIGADDLKKMRKRIALIKDLRKHVRGMPEPESDAERAKLDAWLRKLNAYADELNTMHNLFENAQPGWDMLIIMTSAEVKEKAEESGAAAKKFGFDRCARGAKRWEYLPE